MAKTRNEAITKLANAIGNLAKLNETTSGEEKELVNDTYSLVCKAYRFIERMEPEEEEPHIDLTEKAFDALSMLRFAEAAIISGEPLRIEGTSDGLGFLLDFCCTTLEEYIAHSEVTE